LAQAVTYDLNGIRAKLIDVRMRGPQLGPSGLHEKFNALLDSVDGADYAPPQQAREVYAELAGQLDEVIGQLKDIVEGKVSELNNAVQAIGLPVAGRAG
ncbi:MAG TPA: hypothetical protein VGR22_10310, partial [Thermomicrobiales bacterium]|nr:hypothetical protein [Thermomicrobiales bacterium]